MTNRQRLALLIPAYNAADHLPRLFQSVDRQTEPFDEVWVYDDCSTDDTAAIAEGYGARVVRGDVNRGCTHGKSILVERTNCEWVHFHDADDLLLPNFVTCAHRWLSREGARYYRVRLRRAVGKRRRPYQCIITRRCFAGG